MSRFAGKQPSTLHELPGQYFWRASVPTVIVGAATGVVAGAVDGGAAAVGAALGVVLVLGFFGLDLLAMKVSTEWSPVATFGAVMTEYVLKITFLAVLFMVLAGQASPQSISTRWVGIGLAVSAVVFLTSLVIAYLSIPTFVVEPEDPESPEGPRDITT